MSISPSAAQYLVGVLVCACFWTTVDVWDTENRKNNKENKQHHQHYHLNALVATYRVNPSPAMLICIESVIRVYNLFILYFHSCVCFVCCPYRSMQIQKIQHIFSGSALLWNSSSMDDQIHWVRGKPSTKNEASTWQGANTDNPAKEEYIFCLEWLFLRHICVCGESQNKTNSILPEKPAVWET